MKSIYKSKILWAGITVIVGGIAALCTGDAIAQEAVIIIIGGVFTILRFFTNQPVGLKTKNK